jgi:hypothetical protein
MHELAVAPDLSISFQRYPYPASGWVGAVPRSWGALPFIAAAPGELILPSPSGEAFWIGLVSPPGARSYLLRVVVSLSSGQRVDVVTGTAPDPGSGRGGIVMPPRFAVEGIARPDGTWWALAREALAVGAPACRGVDLSASPGPPVSGRPADSLRLHDAGEMSDRPRGPSAAPVWDAGASVSVHVDVTDPASFEALSREHVPPLDPDAVYGGWRLP